MAEILIDEVVGDLVEGIDATGAFDVIMSAIELRLQTQYDKGRIRGEDYATVYLGAMQSALTQSIQFVLNRQQADKVAAKSEAEIALLTQKNYTEQAQTQDTVNGLPVTGIVGKQKDLYGEQATAFIRDAEQKGMKAFTDLWTIARSTDPDGLSTALPLNANQASMDVMLAKIAAGMGVTQAELGVPSVPVNTKDITNAVKASGQNVVVTVPAHGLVSGDVVRINSVLGMVELNTNNYIITFIDNDSFSLNNTAGNSYTSYTSDGAITIL